ncbi:MAG: hypothetical protein M1826_001232 [Phylliscum demangeonii]|nr:MAG: hypothetical protein M1826_001232 [Phylliscum demangeonii]
MHLEWYARGWLALASVVPAVVAVPMAQGWTRMQGTSARAQSRPQTDGHPFNAHDVVVAGAGAALALVPAAVGMGFLAARHRGAISDVRAETEKVAAVRAESKKAAELLQEQVHSKMRGLQAQIQELGHELESQKVADVDSGGLQDQVQSRMNGLQSRLRQLGHDLEGAKGDMTRQQARQQAVEEVIKQVGGRVANLGQKVDDHDSDLRRTRDSLYALERHVRPLQAEWVRRLLAANDELWACVEAHFDLSTFRYRDGFFMIPLAEWREAVRPCSDKPGWTPDLGISGNNFFKALPYTARPAPPPSSSSPDLGSAPSPFADAQAVTSHWWAQTAHAARRFFAHLPPPALARAAAKVEKAGPVPVPGWARVVE